MILGSLLAEWCAPSANLHERASPRKSTTSSRNYLWSPCERCITSPWHLGAKADEGFYLRALFGTDTWTFWRERHRDHLSSSESDHELGTLLTASAVIRGEVEQLPPQFLFKSKASPNRFLVLEAVPSKHINFRNKKTHKKLSSVCILIRFCYSMRCASTHEYGSKRSKKRKEPMCFRFLRWHTNEK